ncbi:hypothetical protein M885DRAFT_517165 [Pelagophyceae sp. CCMP2097]|nr:hypothetical protein M885DRAFT_517165 [Pelagophyceae sp. CCMP2097]
MMFQAPPAALRGVDAVVFRSAHGAADAAQLRAGHDRAAGLDALQRSWQQGLPPTVGLEAVDIEGETFYEIGRTAAGNHSDIDVPPLFRLRAKAAPTLHDARGVAKAEGAAPLGIAYDDDGVPVPDWRIVDDSKDENGHDVIDADGRRRGGYRIEGCATVEQYCGASTRQFPEYGKRFGSVTKRHVGRFGTLSVEEARLCLTTEDFGFRLGDDAHLAPTPPLLRLCYGELHREAESLRVFTGLSEVHLDKDAGLEEAHGMLHGLGYVCYNNPSCDGFRDWGPGIDVHPNVVEGGLDAIEGTRNPTYYSWYYRLPPFVAGLALEGEAGDLENGPVARALRARADRAWEDQLDLNAQRLEALEARVAEDRAQPWYASLEAAEDATAFEYDDDRGAKE